MAYSVFKMKYLGFTGALKSISRCYGTWKKIIMMLDYFKHNEIYIY